MTITWKKAAGTVGALSLALTLAACGGSTDKGGAAKSGETKAVTLKVWSPQEDKEWLAAQQAAFEKAHPEYKITWKNDVVSEADAGKTVQQDPAAAADVYMFANDQLGTLIDAGAIGELGANEAKQVTDQNDEVMVKSVTGTDGKLYGVPFTGNTWFMYYNKAKLTADDVKSFDTMLEKAKVSFPLDNAWYIQSFYSKAADLKFFGDGTKAEEGIKLDPAKAGKVTAYLAGVVANPNFVNDKDGSGLGALKAGNVDVVFSGTWDAANVKEALGENYAAAVPPMIKVDGTDYQMDAFAGSKAIAYNPKTKDVKAASQFAAFLGSKDAQKAHYEMRGIVPTDKSLAGDIKDDDLAAKAQVDTIANASILQPTIAAMGGWWEPAGALGAGLVNKEVTPANAAEKVGPFVEQMAKVTK
ncbi:arabinogalactan oligomer/maltooligosaccharide transport system substrate-binding protein [Arcanobacterium wilhelmae]|uniref:Arabinogalactan oligomer/maltooligosaccharide transport system substrate-binding protein n=1 Tax=Arcanobacterium wilhelmae TaxID=1803177 RepID=A0ABT9NAH1_9ACTO|nr:extracellular solute-binding protein [Arcanobacterium wilhelmae]MDP9800490.1 arabinogalactan oligomer/maltooligosaccharide transport system substrate-binding protein [Arcanobacterium wilhelmae]WFN89909.1 extracellular solute-binding protein [Arcanobacterium wilhelmae]